MIHFKNILEFQKRFNTEDKCRKYLELQRWNGTPACPKCGSINVCRFSNGKVFKCREKQCNNFKFSVLVGSVYENTKIPLTKWFLATYILTVHSKGISSLQLASWLGITQKSAWHLNHRIREMLKDSAPEKLENIVEVDETFIGGKLGNIHRSKKKGKKPLDNKTTVFGAVERGGKVKTKVIPDTDSKTLVQAVKEFVTPNSTMVSDEKSGYRQVSGEYKHESVYHRADEYVRYTESLIVHTNTIEGYWNILKKQISGIHHFVSPKHLQRYCNENAFRYNNKQICQSDRFETALSNCNGNLNYKKLTSKCD
ncbi:MAG: IS1595 family transposase [Bacteroidetes bacterium]|nr:IS1595 family transposase [Bacteroidota bacterium]